MSTGKICRSNMDCSPPSTCSYNDGHIAVCVICASNGTPEKDVYNCCGKHLVPNTAPGSSGLVCAECQGDANRDYMDNFDDVNGGPNFGCPCIKWDVSFELDPRTCSTNEECCFGGKCDNGTGHCVRDGLPNGSDCRSCYNCKFLTFPRPYFFVVYC